MELTIIYAVIAGVVAQTAVHLMWYRWGQVGEIKRLRDQVKTLQEKVTLLESGHQDAPVPIWLKDTGGAMLALNPAYEEVFLLPINKTRKDYLYHSDYDIWPEEVADEYRKNDHMVMRTKKTWMGYETILDHQGKKHKWRVIKYPRRAGGVIIGIAGMAIPMD